MCTWYQEDVQRVRAGRKAKRKPKRHQRGLLLTSACPSILSFSKTSQYSHSSSSFRISFTSSAPPLLAAVLIPCEQSHQRACLLLPLPSGLSPLPKQQQQQELARVMLHGGPRTSWCSSSSGAAFWFVRRSNRMRDPGNRARAEHQHQGREKPPSTSSGVPRGAPLPKLCPAMETPPLKSGFLCRKSW